MELKDISGIAITLLLTTIVIALMAAVLASFQSNMEDKVTSHANETLTWTGNNTQITLGATRINAATVVLWNNNVLVKQGSTTPGVGNYSVGDNYIIITNISGNGGTTGAWVTTAYNVTYNYNIGSVAYNTSRYGLTTTDTIASYLPLLGLISIAAIIVGIVLVMFMRRSQ